MLAGYNQRKLKAHGYRAAVQLLVGRKFPSSVKLSSVRSIRKYDSMSLIECAKTAMDKTANGSHTRRCRTSGINSASSPSSNSLLLPS
eukprot:m.180770 g.180770  ORF g.180770 m.180770 type:complete len:88 (+) comp39260_c0_seq13:1481-1744(+)